MMTRDIVFRKVPELNDITHAEMREKCADTLLEALRLGGWSSFEMLEETPYLENGKPGPELLSGRLFLSRYRRPPRKGRKGGGQRSAADQTQAGAEP